MYERSLLFDFGSHIKVEISTPKCDFKVTDHRAVTRTLGKMNFVKADLSQKIEFY